MGTNHPNEPVRLSAIRIKATDGVTEELLTAIVETALRMQLTPEQFVVKCVKDKLIGLGVVWWQSNLEINTPGDT